MQKLYRSTRDKKLTGLCGGLAEIFNIDPTLLRLVVAVAAFFSAGTVFFIYIVASLIIPKEPRYNNPYDPYGSYNQGPQGPGKYQGNYNQGSNGNHGNHGNPFNGNPYQAAGSGRYYGQRPEQQSGPYRSTYETKQDDSNIDEMMKEVEKKALQKEIEELRAKLAQMEKNNKGTNKGDV
jgi:phage shock protein C